MHYLHQQQIIHRDLAARNVLIAQKLDRNLLHVKISDFGLAFKAPAKVAANHPTGTAAGRLQFSTEMGSIPVQSSAPEVLEGGRSHPVTFKSDVWSFGIFLYELFTRQELPYGLLSLLTS